MSFLRFGAPTEAQVDPPERLGPPKKAPRGSKVRPGRPQGDTGETTRTQKRAQEGRKEPQKRSKGHFRELQGAAKETQ